MRRSKSKLLHDLNCVGICAVVVRRDQGQLESVTTQLRDTVPNLEVVYADQPTEGAACTCLLARHHIDNLRPLLIINSDQYIDWNDAGDSSDYWRQVEHEAKQGFDANILCFKRAMELGDTKWSYAAMDSEGFVHTVREKEVLYCLAVHACVFDISHSSVSKLW